MSIANSCADFYPNKYVKLPFALTPENKMVSIDAVERGLSCECLCPQCRGALVAVKGEVVRHHFRHYTNANCLGSFETGLHLFAKQIICATPALLMLPDRIDLGEPSSAIAEIALGDIRPDVLLQYEGEPVAVEIFVTHLVDSHKLAKYAEREHTAIEIDLSRYRHVDLDKTGNQQWIEDLILHAANRYWLVEPLFIREERERLRQLLIEQRIEKSRLAIIAAAEAERNRIELEKQKATYEKEQQEANKIRETQRLLDAAREREYQAKQQEILEQLRLDEIGRQTLLRKTMEEQTRRERAPPDLQALVMVHGSYQDIPQEAWTEYDIKRADWQARTRSGGGGSPSSWVEKVA